MTTPEDRRDAGLGQAEQDLGDEVAHATLDRPPALERADQGHLVGVLEVAADRQAAGDPADRADHRLESLGEVHRGRLAFERRVGGHDHLDERRAVAGGCVGPLEELADLEPVRADAVDRRDGAVEDVVAGP